MQFGVDKQIAPETPVLLGAFMGITHGNAHYASGSGDLNASHVGLYISALANNGLGVSAQIAGHHVVYLEGDTSTGQQFNQRQFNAGYRFSF